MTYSHVRYAETGLVKEMRDDVRVVYGPSVNPSESRTRHTLAATFLLAFAMLFAAALPAQAPDHDLVGHAGSASHILRGPRTAGLRQHFGCHLAMFQFGQAERRRLHR